MKYYHEPKRKEGKAGTEQGYIELACAIVFQAIDDYRQADEKLPRKKAKRAKMDIEIFILSPWFTELSDLDPAAVVEALRRQEGREI